MSRLAVSSSLPQGNGQDEDFCTPRVHCDSFNHLVSKIHHYTAPPATDPAGRALPSSSNGDCAYPAFATDDEDGNDDINGDSTNNNRCRHRLGIFGRFTRRLRGTGSPSPSPSPSLSPSRSSSSSSSSSLSVCRRRPCSGSRPSPAQAAYQAQVRARYRRQLREELAAREAVEAAAAAVAMAAFMRRREVLDDEEVGCGWLGSRWYPIGRAL